MTGVVDVELLDIVVEFEGSTAVVSGAVVQSVLEADSETVVVEYLSAEGVAAGLDAVIVVEHDVAETVVSTVRPADPLVDDDLSLAYDIQGRLSTVTIDSGEVLTLTYGANGLALVSSSLLPDPVATLTYASGRLSRVVFGVD